MEKKPTAQEIVAARRRKGVVVRVNTLASGQSVLGSKSLDLSQFVEKATQNLQRPHPTSGR
jgi:hypothetical protein